MDRLHHSTSIDCVGPQWKNLPTKSLKRSRHNGLRGASEIFRNISCHQRQAIWSEMEGWSWNPLRNLPQTCPFLTCVVWSVWIAPRTTLRVSGSYAVCVKSPAAVPWGSRPAAVPAHGALQSLLPAPEHRLVLPTHHPQLRAALGWLSGHEHLVRGVEPPQLLLVLPESCLDRGHHQRGGLNAVCHLCGQSQYPSRCAGGANLCACVWMCVWMCVCVCVGFISVSTTLVVDGMPCVYRPFGVTTPLSTHPSGRHQEWLRR